MVDYEREPVVVRDGGSGGIIAVLVVVVVLLVAGFLYFTRYGDVDRGTDVEITVPKPDAGTPDVTPSPAPPTNRP